MLKSLGFAGIFSCFAVKTVQAEASRKTGVLMRLISWRLARSPKSGVSSICNDYKPETRKKQGVMRKTSCAGSVNAALKDGS